MRSLLISTALLFTACSPFTWSEGDGGVGGGGGTAAGGGTGGGGVGGGGQTVEATTLPDGGMATWYRDVLPVAQTRCQGCHTAGGIAPFAMDSYANVKTWAPAMAADVVSRKMPPWTASPGCGMDYRDSRRMTQAEIDVFTAWSANNGAEGNPADAPAPFQQPGLPWVDASLTPSAAYTPSATITDDYHCTLIDPGLTSAKSLIGYQVIPGVRAEVHHVILFSVDKTDAVAKNTAEGGNGWTCFGGSGVNGEQMLGGWVPGSGIVEYPAGTGIPLAAGKMLVMQIHYNTSNGVRQPDTTAIQFQYGKTPVIPAALVGIYDYSFSIPPNAMGYTPPGSPKLTSNILGYDAKVWGVLPHMHTKGKKITVSGPTGCYVEIPEWDFHWQQQYQFTAPRIVKKNENVSISCTWDNPTNKAVTWGEGTDDEMCLAFLYITQ